MPNSLNSPHTSSYTSGISNSILNTQYLSTSTKLATDKENQDIKHHINHNSNEGTHKSCNLLNII